MIMLLRVRHQGPGKLGLIQLLIDAAGIDQIRMASPFHNASVLDDQYLVRRENGGETMGNQNAGVAADNRIDGLLDFLLGDGIRLMMVLFPDPDGPTMAMLLPAFRVKEISFSTVRSGSYPKPERVVFIVH